MGDGQFYAVVPKLITDCGTEINAVVLQAVCSLLYGAAWAGAIVIWLSQYTAMKKKIEEMNSKVMQNNKLNN